MLHSIMKKTTLQTFFLAIVLSTFAIFWFFHDVQFVKLLKFRILNKEKSSNIKIKRTAANPELFAYKLPNIDCAKLIAKDPVEMSKNWTAYSVTNAYHLDINNLMDSVKTDENYCDHFKKERKYVTSPLSQEEEEMPLAYSVMIFKEPEMFEKLLRTIYRPQNFYCVHVDLSSEKFVHAAAQAIAHCFENVFIPTNLIDVVYSKFTSLEADLLCMRELLKRKKWKYFINLTGQEFPLQTSIALVRIMNALNGANLMEGTVKRRNNERYEPAGKLPANITLTKGAVHIIASRAFVDYAINNEMALKFLEWVKKTIEPDETFFSSLNHSPQLGVPGAYRGEPESFTVEYPFLTRFKNWISGPSNCPCGGKYVHSICVFGVNDLAVLSKRQELFTNKFHLDYQPAAYACMEELLFNRTADELAGRNVFNASYYAQLSVANNHV